GGNEQLTLVAGVPDRVVDRVAVAPAGSAPTGVNGPSAAVGGVADRRRQGRVAHRGAGVGEDAHDHHRELLAHAADADAVVTDGAHDAGGVGPVAAVGGAVVVGVVVALGEVPANDVVGIGVVGVAPAVDAVIPPAGRDRLEQVAAVDVAVAVDVGHERAVAGGVEVVERDPAIAVGVAETGLVIGGDLRLINPHVLIQVLVCVVGAGVGVGDHHGGAAAGRLPCTGHG